MKIRAQLLLCGIALWCSQALADAEVGVEPVPDWATERALEDFVQDRADEFQGGVAFLLNDHQVRKSDSGYDYVDRIAYRVVDRSGLEAAASLARAFDPEEETLAFNFVRIRRDGEVIDELTNAEITVLRQEEGLNAGILDGNRTALIQLEDIRVGDVIDYSLSGSVTTRLWPDELFESFVVEWPMPLANLYYTLTVPADYPVDVHVVATDVNVEESRAHGEKTFTVHIVDADPVRVEQNVPQDWITFGRVIFTTADSWSDIVDWAVPLFSFDELLPAAFASKLDAIANDYPLAEDQAVQTLRLVQNEIRYLGLEVGLGSHVPRSPSTTIKRGYGDCKDKSVLLVAALDYLGIEAVPVLASIAAGGVLPQLPPTLTPFDHAIVAIDLGDSTLWVDPTQTYQGGDADSLTPLNYGHVLPIRTSQSELVEPEMTLSEYPNYDVSESFHFPAEDDQPLRAISISTFRRASADYVRARLASSGRAAFGRASLDYYASLYAGVSADGDLEVVDDLKRNVLTVTTRFQIDAQALADNGYADEFPVHVSAPQNLLPATIEADRSAPLAIPLDTFVKHSARLSAPTAARRPLPDDKFRQVSGIGYSRTFRYDDDVLVVNTTLTVRQDAVAAEAARSVIALADEIKKEGQLTIYVGAADESLAERLALNIDLSAETESAVLNVLQQVLARNDIAALTATNKLLATHEKPSTLRGYLLQLKGSVLTRLGRPKAAVVAFKEGFALYEPVDLAAYFSYTDSLRQSGDPAGAAANLIRMLERRPDSIERANAAWLRSFSRQLYQFDLHSDRESLLAAIARAVHLSDASNGFDLSFVFPSAVKTASRRKDWDDAAAYVGYIRDPEELSALYANRNTKRIWKTIEDKAGDDLHKAIEDYVLLTRRLADEHAGNIRRQTDHLRALRVAQQYDAAIAFGAPLANDWALIEATGRDAYWFVNQYAYTLAEAGQLDAALDAYERLLALGVESNRDLISMAINRALMLLDWGDFSAALAAIEEIETWDREIASEYGWMWVYSGKACALEQLGRSEEADRVFSQAMEPLASANPAAATKVLLCLNRLDEAEDLVIERLADPLRADTALDAFVDVSDPTSGPIFLVELHRRARTVESRRRVQQALRNVGRSITVAGSLKFWSDY